MFKLLESQYILLREPQYKKYVAKLFLDSIMAIEWHLKILPGISKVGYWVWERKGSGGGNFMIVRRTMRVGITCSWFSWLKKWGEIKQRIMCTIRIVWAI